MDVRRRRAGHRTGGRRTDGAPPLGRAGEPTGATCPPRRLALAGVPAARAAVAIAGVLLAVVTNGAVEDALLKFILQVIHSFSG